MINTFKLNYDEITIQLLNILLYHENIINNILINNSTLSNDEWYKKIPKTVKDELKSYTINNFEQLLNKIQIVYNKLLINKLEDYELKRKWADTSYRCRDDEFGGYKEW